MKIIISIISALFIFMVISGCSVNTNPANQVNHEIDPNLIGYWEYNYPVYTGADPDYNDFSYYYPEHDYNDGYSEEEHPNRYDKLFHFNEDGTYHYCNITDGPVNGTWWAENNTVYLLNSFYGTISSHTYSFTASDIIRMDGDTGIDFIKTTLFDINQKQLNNDTEITYFENGFTFTATIDNTNHKVTLTINNVSDITEYTGYVEIRIKDDEHSMERFEDNWFNNDKDEDASNDVYKMTFNIINTSTEYTNIEFSYMKYSLPGAAEYDLTNVKYYNNYWNIQ